MYSRNYLIYDSDTYLVTGKPIAEVNAERMFQTEQSPQVLMFRDDKNRNILIHHLTPGHSIMAFDADGNQTTL